MPEAGKFLTHWLPWYAYLGLIFFISSLQNPERTFGFSASDFAAHILEYAGLLFLTRRAFDASGIAGLRVRSAVTGILFCLLYAASDEFHQSFVPTRDPSLIDFAYDAAGVLLGGMIYKRWRVRFP